MFRHDTKKPMSEEEFTNSVVDDIVDNLDDEDKQNWIDNFEYDHFGRGMWIRNKYLWGQNIPSTYHPDDLSEEIFKKVIEKLKEK